MLDQVYKLYARPHFNYGDIIYYRYDPAMINVIKRLQQTQYHAALAIPGAWRGTNWQKTYEELDWEDLYHRRWTRHLCYFHNLRKTGTSGYLFPETPPEHQESYNPRHP